VGSLLETFEGLYIWVDWTMRIILWVAPKGLMSHPCLHAQATVPKRLKTPLIASKVPMSGRNFPFNDKGQCLTRVAWGYVRPLPSGFVILKAHHRCRLPKDGKCTA